MEGRTVNLINGFELNDDPSTLKDFRNFLKEQLLELFNLKYTFLQQKPEIRTELQHRIRQRFPYLFENDKTIASQIWGAKGYVKGFYGRERMKWLVSAQKKTMSIQEERSLNIEKQQSSGFPPLKAQSTGRHLNAPKKIARTGPPRTGGSNSITSYFETSRSSRCTPPISINSSPSPRISPTNNIPTISSSHLATTSPTANGPEYRITEVRNFLSTCVPNVEHLLAAFLDYGIRNKEILHVLATEWSGEELEKLLKNVFQCVTEGGGAHSSTLVPEIDIQILKKHLKRSFISSV